MFMWWVSTEMRVRADGSYTTRSASAPGRISPLRGYRPNIRAGVVQHSSTQRASEIRPSTTPW